MSTKNLKILSGNSFLNAVDEEGKIWATTDPNLSDIPKIPELKEDIDTLAHNAAIGSGYELHDIVKNAWARGYKAASKKYTEEDIRKAIVRGASFGFEFVKGTKTGLAMELAEGKVYEIIQSINPVPKEIELEMEDAFEETQGEIRGIYPKLKDGYVIIKSVKYE